MFKLKPAKHFDALLKQAMTKFFIHKLMYTFSCAFVGDDVDLMRETVKLKTQNLAIINL